MPITFCPLDIGIGPEEIAQMKSAIQKIPNEYWYDNEFRSCSMLPLLNRGGHLCRLEIAADQTSDFKWTKVSEMCAPVVRTLNDHVFPWMEEFSRVTVLRLRPHAALNVHIDCKREEVGSTQHKFRIVLNGATSDLFFIGPDGKSHHSAPAETPVYVLDGGHPHSAVNRSSEDRYTLCIASPWKGENTKYRHLLEANLSRAMHIERPAIEPEWCDINRFGYK